MKIYGVYKIIYDNAKNFELVDQYTIESVGIKGIEKNAINFVKSQVGEIHMGKSIQYGRTIEEIQNDVSLKDGYYLIRNGNDITVLGKSKIITHERKEVCNIVPTVSTCIVSEEVEVNVVEKVKKIITTPASSIFYYFGASGTEEEVEVDELVPRKFKIDVEREICTDKVEITYEYVKKKQFITVPICTFSMFEIDITSYCTTKTVDTVINTQASSEHVTQKVNNKQSLFMNELVNLLNNSNGVSHLRKTRKSW